MNAIKQATQPKIQKTF